MKPTLVIMAAGMGSRYGGLKQIDPIGPNGEVIMDYSIFDAVRAGFGKIVFVIRTHFEQAFREQISTKFGDTIHATYAFQELDKCMGDYAVPAEREKPWGTAHAVLVAGKEIDGPFAVINADDFYGAEAFSTLAQWLTETADEQDQYAMVGYKLFNTLSEHGHVSRGVCRTREDGKLEQITEYLKLQRTDGEIKGVDENGEPGTFTGDETVSMNFWGFKPSFIEHLQTGFAAFVEANLHQYKAEYYIPDAVDALLKSGQASVEVLVTHGRWFGVTYREDRDKVAESIAELVRSGQYPQNLW